MYEHAHDSSALNTANPFGCSSCCHAHLPASQNMQNVGILQAHACVNTYMYFKQMQTSGKFAMSPLLFAACVQLQGCGHCPLQRWWLNQQEVGPHSFRCWLHGTSSGMKSLTCGNAILCFFLCFCCLSVQEPCHAASAVTLLATTQYRILCTSLRQSTSIASS